MVIIFLISNFAFAENSLYSRVEYGWDKKTRHSYNEVYNVFETPLSFQFKGGAKIISGHEGYKKLNPFIYYPLSKTLEIGLRYAADSRRNEFVAPSIRLKEKIGIISIGFSYEENINLHKGKNVPEAWLGISAPLTKLLSCGLESRYLNPKDEIFQFRPLKISYDFSEGFSSFIMFQGQWEEWVKTKNAIFMGGIMRW